MRKTNQLFVFFALFLFTIWGNQAYSQISEGGTPPSFLVKQSMQTKSNQPGSVFKAEINFDVEKLKSEDAINVSRGEPPVVARVISASLNMENSGEWIKLPNGIQIWQLTINAQGALATNLYYDKFYIPKGGKLFIYNKQKSQILGAYTEITNKMGGEFATEFVAGDEIVLEYVPSQTLVKKDEKPNISISGIGYGYNHIKLENATHIGAGGSCQVNINCSEGDNWQNEKKGVVKTIQLVGVKQFLCSGTIVNNTARDFKPYYLTAFHCFKDGSRIASESNLNKMIFYFHFENPGCENINNDPITTKTMVGAAKKVFTGIDQKSDGALLLLNDNIPDDWSVYYNGWDRRNIAPTEAVGIHHPGGDLKKISTSISGSATSSTWDAEGIVSLNDGHWRLQWAKTKNGNGVTEGGSSGSPLFNQNRLVVGTLTGGNTDGCYVYGSSSYGKLWAHWDKTSINAEERMKTYLDPGNTGEEFIEGSYSSNEPMANFAVIENVIFAGETIKFSDLTFKATTYKWTFEGGIPSTSTEATPSVLYEKPGAYNVTLVINEGIVANGESLERTKTELSFITVNQKYSECVNKIVIGDVNSTTSSQYPLGQGIYHVFSSSIYTRDEIGNVPGEITELSWYAKNEIRGSRTVYIYMKEVDEDTQTAVNWSEEINTANATLVYQNAPGIWSNAAGWNTLPLKNKFRYSGTKNLKIIVRTQTNRSGTSADWLYSTAENKHMSWSNNGPGLPSAAGTINDNRPVIKIKLIEDCTKNINVDFAFGQIDIYKQGFDEGVLPTGWNFAQKGPSSRGWEIISNNDENNNPSFSFKHRVDPSSLYTMYIKYDNSNIQDAWVISEPFDIEPKTFLEFWQGHSGQYLGDGYNSLFVSVEGGDWEKIWTNGDAHLSEVDWGWFKYTVALNEYAGKNIRLAWQYYGNWGIESTLDGIRMYKWDAGPIETFEGETVNLFDLSEGAPVAWDWTFEGAEPSTSKVANPKVKYMLAGEYKITLTVRSGETTVTKTKEKVVIVKGRVPKPKLAALITNGYNRKANWGAYFAPNKDGGALIRGEAENVAKSYNWTFDGGTPPSSTQLEPAVVRYNAEKARYDIKFEATNPTGTGKLLIKDAINIGYVTDTIWNMHASDLGVTAPLYYGRFTMTSSASLHAKGFAELFYEPMVPGEITAVELKLQQFGNQGYFNVGIYTKLGGEPLVTKKVNFIDVNNDGFTKVVFDKPIGINTQFFVVVDDFTNIAAKGELVIYAGIPRFYVAGTAYLKRKSNNTWVSFNEAYDNTGFVLNIAPIFTYTYFNTDKNYILKQTKDRTSDIVTITTNATYCEAISLSHWIKIDKTEQVVNGESKISIKVNCDENTVYDLRKGIIKISAGGHTKYVVVEQAGAAPVDLFAEAVGEGENDVKLLWKTSKTTIGDNALSLFDDFEDHVSFTVNSPGIYGWSYIDGDKLGTYGWPDAALNFPNKYAAMSFMVFDSEQSTPPVIQYDFFKPHSGTKFLMCNTAADGNNDDWVISPELSFKKEFNFSFWAKCFNPANPARFVVYYSTTGKNKADFTHKLTSGDYVKITNNTTWAKYDIKVPAEAKYVAINCVTIENEMGILFVDDIYIGESDAPRTESSAIQNFKTELLNIDETTLLNGLSKSTSEINLEGNTNPFAKEFETKFSGQSSPVNNKMKMQSATNEDNSYYDAILRWDNRARNIDITGKGTVSIVIKFDAFDLINYHNADIKAIEFIPINTQSKYKLKIYQDGKLVLSQDITSKLIYNEFNSISLKEPFRIDASKDLMIGYEIANGELNWVVGSLNNLPTVKGKGNLLANGESEFVGLDEVSNITYGNWNIGMFVKSAKSAQTYHVYREGEKIAESSDITFIDEQLMSSGDICYQVASVQYNISSALSNNACVYLKTPITITANDLTRYYNQPNPDVKSMYTISGFQDDDSESMLETKPTVTIDNSQYGEYASVGIYENVLVAAGAKDATGKYRFVYKNGTLTVKVEEIVSVVEKVVPSEAFSPNGDGVNDYFIISGIELFPDNELTIFDRSGSIHYNVKGYANNWDGIANTGKFKGDKLPVGTYYYVLKIQGQKDIKKFIVIRY